nr:helix-turn-helix transcriptional regulator [Clostridia bacterium]
MEITVGANIKRLRIEKGITQEQLAEAMNVSCAAVSKWERAETYPDITLLQPLAYYFGVTLDTLMGYDREVVQAKIDETLAEYRKYWLTDYKRAREIIVKAYHDYPNDWWVMHYYMWNIGGDMADNDPEVLLAHKDEFLAICQKLIDGCTEETLRLNAWNMRAKLLHAEGKTEEALEIYRTKFTNWYHTCGQKSEQLFAKDTPQYYSQMKKNMFELEDFAADKLGRKLFFDSTLTTSQKAERAVKYGEMMLNAAAETGEYYFAVMANSFLGRMENDLFFRGGSDSDVAAVMEIHLRAAMILTGFMNEDAQLCENYLQTHTSVKGSDLLKWLVELRLNAKSGRRAELLKVSEYAAVLDKYR